MIKAQESTVDYWLSLAPKIWINDAEKRSALNTSINLIKNKPIRYIAVHRAKIEALKILLNKNDNS